ncbi:MAG TPA: hypothetical protein VEF92_08570 [Burkholderiales bacterium]|nr:hypothetical protein [Burkholderiales bacterium]
MKVVLAALALAASATTAAQVPQSFLDRVEQDYRSAMKAQDDNRDGAVTRDEAHGNLLLLGLFDDIDTDRDGRITQEELERFLRALPDSPQFR